eukprot:GHUV01016336.1.p2 GENE.GHUV01016336.1~~GHUV01016336.1.p2  ORF type:complete len:116 (-),score=9.07 GHUV01016336.1:321-668(-)
MTAAATGADGPTGRSHFAYAGQSLRPLNLSLLSGDDPTNDCISRNVLRASSRATAASSGVISGRVSWRATSSRGFAWATGTLLNAARSNAADCDILSRLRLEMATAETGSEHLCC